MVVVLATSTVVVTTKTATPAVLPPAPCPRGVNDVALGLGAGHHEESEREEVIM